MDENNGYDKETYGLKKQTEIFQKLSNKEKLEFLDGITKQRNENVGVFLNLIYAEEKDKNIQKRIRALIHKLKTTGIHIEQPEVSGESALKRIEEKRAHLGYLSNYDDFNSRIVFSAFEVKKNKFIFLSAEIRFMYGLVDLDTFEIDKKEIDDTINKFRYDKDKQLVIADVSFCYAGHILEEESKKSNKYRDDILQMRRITSHIKDTIQEPKDIYHLECPDTTRPMELEKILTHTILEPFTITWSSLEEDKKEYNNLGGSPLILPPYLVEEKRQALLKSILEKDDIRSTLPYIKRMLEDYAYIFYSIQEFPYYKGIVNCLQDPATPINTALYFIKKSIEEDELVDEEIEEDGIIINPYG